MYVRICFLGTIWAKDVKLEVLTDALHKLVVVTTRFEFDNDRFSTATHVLLNRLRQGIENKSFTRGWVTHGWVAYKTNKLSRKAIIHRVVPLVDSKDLVENFSDIFVVELLFNMETVFVVYKL